MKKTLFASFPKYICVLYFYFTCWSAIATNTNLNANKPICLIKNSSVYPGYVIAEFAHKSEELLIGLNESITIDLAHTEDIVVQLKIPDKPITMRIFSSQNKYLNFTITQPPNEECMAEGKKAEFSYGPNAACKFEMYWKRGYDYNDWLVVKNDDNKEESAVVDKKKSYAMVTVWDTNMHVIGRYQEGSFIDFKCNSDSNKWMSTEALRLHSPHFPYFMDFSLANIKTGWDFFTPQRFLRIECIYNLRFASFKFSDKLKAKLGFLIQDGNYYKLLSGCLEEQQISKNYSVSPTPEVFPSSSVPLNTTDPSETDEYTSPSKAEKNPKVQAATILCFLCLLFAEIFYQAVFHFQFVHK